MKELQNLQKEVTVYYKALGDKLGREILYNIFYSNFSENADILFIGINPGNGAAEMWTEIKENFQYLDNDHTLARETLKVFELAGYPNLLQKLNDENKVVKTNLYYASTRGLSELNKFKKELRDKGWLEKFIHNSHRWIEKIISITKPKIIIYEGATAYNECPPFTSQLTLEDHCEKKNAGLYKYKELPYVMLYYKRFQSRIRDKEEFAAILQYAIKKYL